MFGKVGCMRIVTGAAVTFSNRTMQVLAFVNFIFHLFMTAKAQVLFFDFQALVIIRRMG